MIRWFSGVGLALVLLGGCAAGTRAPEIAVPAHDGWARGHDAGPLGRWVQVRKRDRQLVLYEDRHPLRVYPVVLGGDPFGAKRHEGDNRTPEGEYHIAAKYPHPSWSRFMLLDYPTAMNRDLYEWTRQIGLLPANGQGAPGVGGQVGIHGTSDEGMNRRGENWTRGCISLLNRDVEELYSMIDVGTRVVIEK